MELRDTLSGGRGEGAVDMSPPSGTWPVPLIDMLDGRSGQAEMSDEVLPDQGLSGPEIAAEHSADPGQVDAVVVEEHEAQVVTDVNETENEDWMDILGNKSLEKKVLRAGPRARRPERGEMVLLHFIGRCRADGVVFENTRTADKPFHFKLGDGDTFQAFELAVALMDIGELCIIRADARWVYGALGRYALVPHLRAMPPDVLSRRFATP
jgi:FKBP-type peptidyl-prolyl cis-trans isomerase